MFSPKILFLSKDSPDDYTKNLYKETPLTLHQTYHFHLSTQALIGLPSPRPPPPPPNL